MKYRKKPVVIEAVQLQNNIQSIAEVQKFIQGGVLNNNSCARARDAWDDYLRIVEKRGGIEVETQEGVLLASFGDYVVKGNSEKLGDHFWPVKPDYFEQAYEAVE